MTRKHTRRRVVIPLPPRGLRPKLARDQVQDLALCHLQNLDAIAKGYATEATLWEFAGSVMTWSKVAQLLKVGEPEMQRQLELAADLVARYGRTGRVLFDGPSSTSWPRKASTSWTSSPNWQTAPPPSWRRSGLSSRSTSSRRSAVRRTSMVSERAR